VSGPRRGPPGQRERPRGFDPRTRRAEPTGPRRAAPAGGEPIYGLRAALAVCTVRPADVVAVTWAPDVEHEVAPIVAPLRLRGVRTNVVPARELERIARSPQHEGIVVEAKERTWYSAKDLAERILARKGVVVALDRVRNSYNVGAILRGAAFFGLDAALLGAPAPHPGLDANAVRVAEGGAEHLALARTTDLADTLARVRARGIAVVGADGEGTLDARGVDFEGPLVIVMGNEREGMLPRVRTECDRIVAIRGSGNVESLNVAVAAGVLFSRVRRPR
jgi:TrmH RNA methyltransferase